MRTIKYLPEDKQKMMAEETIQIYVPIAHKLNITKIKNELEDLYLSVTDPAAYNEIRKALEEKKKEKYEEIENIRKEIETLIRSKGIDATVKSREKHIYSIYKKMKRKELTFEQLMDLFAIRIITKRVSDCYKVLDIISENYSIIPGTLDDYIVTPKSNMYQSIHVNFLTKKGQNIEAQIRTEEMDIIAERGIAAHWKYKGYKEESYDKKIEWMKNLLNWQREIKEQKEYIDGIRIELFERGVIVFTPKGDMLELPHGATALDFAFALHTSLGLNADKIKVNGKIVSFDHQLADGDIVEVIPAPAPKVNVNWLKFVKTSKAKAKIRAALNITGPKKPLKIKEEKIEQMKGEKAKIQNGVLIVDINSPNIRLAKCCNPTINDEIISYPPKEGKYTIHRRDCQIFRNTPEYKKRIEAKWKEIEGIYLQKINIVGEDRPKLLSNIIKTILQIGLKIQKINIDTRNEKIIINIILLYKKKEEIKNVKKSLKNIEGVKEVYTII
jgi:RelA/SpoT family (p)ppGpp synthetase